MLGMDGAFICHCPAKRQLQGSQATFSEGLRSIIFGYVQPGPAQTSDICFAANDAARHLADESRLVA